MVEVVTKPRWNPPMQGYLKLNTDRSWKVKNNVGVKVLLEGLMVPSTLGSCLNSMASAQRLLN